MTKQERIELLKKEIKDGAYDERKKAWLIFIIKRITTRTQIRRILWL